MVTGQLVRVHREIQATMPTPNKRCVGIISLCLKATDPEGIPKCADDIHGTRLQMCEATLAPTHAHGTSTRRIQSRL